MTMLTILAWSSFWTVGLLKRLPATLPHSLTLTLLLLYFHFFLLFFLFRCALVSTSPVWKLIVWTLSVNTSYRTLLCVFLHKKNRILIIVCKGVLHKYGSFDRSCQKIVLFEMLSHKETLCCMIPCIIFKVSPGKTTITPGRTTLLE